VKKPESVRGNKSFPDFKKEYFEVCFGSGVWFKSLTHSQKSLSEKKRVPVIIVLAGFFYFNLIIGGMF